MRGVANGARNTAAAPARGTRSARTTPSAGFRATAVLRWPHTIATFASDIVTRLASRGRASGKCRPRRRGVLSAGRRIDEIANSRGSQRSARFAGSRLVKTARPGRPSSHLRKWSIRTRRRRERRRCWCSPAALSPASRRPVPRPWRSRFSFAFSTDARDASRSTTTRRATRASPWRAWRASSSAWRVSQPRSKSSRAGRASCAPPTGASPRPAHLPPPPPPRRREGRFRLQPPRRRQERRHEQLRRVPRSQRPPRAARQRRAEDSRIRRARGGTRTRSRRVTTHQQRGKPYQT